MSDPGKTVARWADQAMFTAEPMTSQVPKVHLISMSADPLGEIASCAKMYKGEVVRSLAEITDAERLQYFDDLQKTVLGAAFESVKFHFLIEGVTRGFTHQLVRQRTAVYFQESTRFAVIDESFADRVGLPPSLVGTMPAAKYRDEIDELELDIETNTTAAQWKRSKWDGAVDAMESAYKSLVEGGMPAEDARGLLPTNLLTRIHYVTDLRNLVAHAGLRLCTQAQMEWRHVFSQISVAIRNAETIIPNGMVAPVAIPVHMADQIADQLFRPVCYKTGKCEFMASFDRACSIRDRVQMNHEIGRPSSEWHESTVGLGMPINIAAIHPAEWLMDPSAAIS